MANIGDAFGAFAQGFAGSFDPVGAELLKVKRDAAEQAKLSDTLVALTNIMLIEDPASREASLLLVAPALGLTSDDPQWKLIAKTIAYDKETLRETIATAFPDIQKQFPGLTSDVLGQIMTKDPVQFFNIIKDSQDRAVAQADVAAVQAAKEDTLLSRLNLPPPEEDITVSKLPEPTFTVDLQGEKVVDQRFTADPTPEETAERFREKRIEALEAENARLDKLSPSDALTAEVEGNAAEITRLRSIGKPFSTHTYKDENNNQHMVIIGSDGTVTDTDLGIKAFDEQSLNDVKITLAYVIQGMGDLAPIQPLVNRLGDSDDAVEAARNMLSTLMPEDAMVALLRAMGGMGSSTPESNPNPEVPSTTTTETPPPPEAAVTPSDAEIEAANAFIAQTLGKE